MTAEGMIRQLQNLIEHGLKPIAIIKSWDGDSEQFQPVSGFVYDADSVELQTDSDDEESISASLEGRGGELELNKLLSDFTATYTKLNHVDPRYATPKYDQYIQGADDFCETVREKLEGTTGELDALRRELAAAKARVCIGGDVYEANRNQHILHLQTELNYLTRAETAEARAAQLEAALRKYGRHTKFCAIDHPDIRLRKCTCGWEAALSATVAQDGKP